MRKADYQIPSLTMMEIKTMCFFAVSDGGSEGTGDEDW